MVISFTHHIFCAIAPKACIPNPSCAADRKSSGVHHRDRSGPYLKRRFIKLFRLLCLLTVFSVFICLLGCSNNVFELYVVELNTPGVSYKINRNPTTNGDVVASGFRFSPDGGALAYVADEDYNDLIEFYLVELAFPAISTKLNSPLVPGGDLTTVFRFTPEDSQLIYLADQDEDEVFEIYRVDIADPGYTVKMNSPLIAGGSVQVAMLIMSGSGNELVYLADQDADDVVELYVVEMTLPGISQKLNPTLPAGGDVVMVDVFPRS